VHLRGISIAFAAALGTFVPAVGLAGAGSETVALGFKTFSQHCLSPHLTRPVLDREEEAIASGVRFDFYDLLPFSAAQVTPVTGRVATAGTDRRCEVSFDTDASAGAAKVAVDALERERISDETPLPSTHADAALPGTTLLAARKLNPQRIAIVHTGARPGANGIETFLMVERLTPEASARHN